MKAKDKTINVEENNSKIDIWRILAYFIIYSVAGFVIETLYGAAKKGVIESRQSFLYGPFCAIYGIGACVMIIGLQKFKKSHNYLFIGGAVLGSIVEYIVSYIGEMMFHVKWWDYSNLPFNVNGRICIAFAVFWGILAMYLMSSLNPKVDKLIDLIKQKFKSEAVLHFAIIIAIWIMLIDCIVTGVALEFFKIRKIEEYNLNVADKQHISEKYNEIYNNEKLSRLIYRFWDDRKMIRTFPNLKIQDKDGKIIYFNTLVPDVEPYYVKIYDKK